MILLFLSVIINLKFGNPFVHTLMIAASLTKGDPAVWKGMVYRDRIRSKNTLFVWSGMGASDCETEWNHYSGFVLGVSAIISSGTKELNKQTVVVHQIDLPKQPGRLT